MINLIIFLQLNSKKNRVYLVLSGKSGIFAVLFQQRNPVRVRSCPATVSPMGKSEYLPQEFRDK